MQKWGNAAPRSTAQTVKDTDQAVNDLAAEMRDITIALLKPCKPGKPETCGLIPSLKTIAPSTVSAMGTVNQSAAKLGTTADALTGTANGATQGLTALTDDLTAAKPTIDTAAGLVAHADSTVGDLDALLKDNAVQWHETSIHIDSMTGSGAKMLADAQWKEHQLLHPDKVKLGFWGSVWLGAKYVHEMMPPLF